MTKEEKIELWKKQIAELEKNIEVLSKSTIEPKEGNFLYSESEEIVFKVTGIDDTLYYCERYDLETRTTYMEDGYSIERISEDWYQFPCDIKIISKEEAMKLVVNSVTQDWFE